MEKKRRVTAVALRENERASFFSFSVGPANSTDHTGVNPRFEYAWQFSFFLSLSLCRLLVSLSLSVPKHTLLPHPPFLLTLILASPATKLTRIPSFLWCHPKCHWPSATLVVLVVLYIYTCVCGCIKYTVRAFIHSCLIRLQSVNKCSRLCSTTLQRRDARSDSDEMFA